MSMAKIESKTRLYPLAVFSSASKGEQIIKPYILWTTKRIFVLKKYLRCVIEKKNEVWYVTNKDLEIEVFEPTKRDAEVGFAEAFNELYEIYVLEDNSRLSRGAIEFKKEIESYILMVYEQ
jgi:hypothetical protein